MTQVTGPLTIDNGDATPVAKTFSPEKISPDAAVFVERSALSSAGYKRIGIGFSPANGGRKTNRVNIEVSTPILANIGGVNSVAYTGLFKGYFVIPDQMTSEERADLAAFVANALDNAQIRAVIKDLDPLY